MSTQSVSGRSYQFGLPDRLRVAREVAGFGQAELAELSGISRSSRTPNPLVWRFAWSTLVATFARSVTVVAFESEQSRSIERSGTALTPKWVPGDWGVTS